MDAAVFGVRPSRGGLIALPLRHPALGVRRGLAQS